MPRDVHYTPDCLAVTGVLSRVPEAEETRGALTYGNSLTFSATFDQDYYLTNRTVSGSIYNHTFDTDANGNITQVGSTTFNFDELNRLEEEDSGSAVNYTYDATKAEAENEIIMILATTELGTCPRNSNGIKIGIVSPDFQEIRFRG